MKKTHVSLKSDFKILLSDTRAQFAEMVLGPGKVEGGPTNSHQGADQWLFVISGLGLAVINGKKHRLRRGSLIFIERGETHEIRNTGRAPLRTLNCYTPPAYSKSGGERAAGKSR